MKHSYEVVIIGGGAAGFFAANRILELRPSTRIVLLEKTQKLLSKVLVSGGGRCNVTNVISDPQEMIKMYPRGGKNLLSLFYQFGQEETVAWFLDKGIKLKTEADGRMFPETNTSETIAKCLYDSYTKKGGEIKLKATVKEIKFNSENHEILLENGDILLSKIVVVASGGAPKKDMLSYIKQSGHSIIDPVPSLFTFNLPKHPITEFMGLSVPNAHIEILNSKFKFQGPLLITHWGLSGPAILKLSAFGARFIAENNYNFSIQINWLGEQKVHTLVESWNKIIKQEGDKKVKRLIPNEIPNRLKEFLIHRAEITSELNLADLSMAKRQKLAEVLCKDIYEVSGKTTFKEEFVTAGGINLKEVDMRTCESKLIPNLYFCGEVLDIDGITGGFNFQAAWSTANAVALNTIERLQ